MFNDEEIKNEENTLRNKANALSDENRKIFYSKVEKKIKDPDTYAALNWFMIAGLHHFYLKKWLNGFINLSIFVVGVALLFSDYSIKIALGILFTIFIIELLQLFRAQSIIQKYNNNVMKKILDDL